ncbi:MAG: outer membrane lipoprotein-sorting protein [Verrucomicrobiota bacterium]
MIRYVFFLIGTLLVVGAAEPPPKPITLPPEQGAIEGAALAKEILSQAPTQPTVSTGVLKIGRELQIPVRFEITLADTNWSSTYEATGVSNGISKLTVVHHDGSPNTYTVIENGAEKTLSGNETMVAFAGSDFWVADLGLEFLFWPEQRVLRKEIRRGQSCSVLESINPHPAPGTYARVLSWVDIDSGGIINAEAYQPRGSRPFKEFAAKSFKKVRGQWELESIEMSNRQSGSRTSLEFDLAK